MPVSSASPNQHQQGSGGGGISQLRQTLRQSLFSSPMNSSSTTPLCFDGRSPTRLILHTETSNSKQQRPLPVALLTPQEFAKLSPQEREQLRQSVKNFTSIATTLASSPSRQTNWHGTYLEPLLDQHNTTLHPSPGPGQYFGNIAGGGGNDGATVENNTLNNYTNEAVHPDSIGKRQIHSKNNIPALYPEMASKFVDDYTTKKLNPGPAKYLGFEHISTVEVSEQGEKKRAENTLWKRDEKTGEPIVSPWKLEQRKQHEELLAKTNKNQKKKQEHSKKSSSPTASSKKQQQPHSSIFMEKVIEEEKKRREEFSENKNHQTGFSFASRNEDFHKGVLANTSNLSTAAPGAYYNDQNHLSGSIAGNSNHKIKAMSKIKVK